MKTSLVIFLASLMGALIAFYIFNLFVDKKLSGITKEEEDAGLSISILKGVTFVSCGMLIVEMHSSYLVLLKIWGTEFSDRELLIKELMFFAVFLGIVILALFVAFAFAYFTFGIISNKKNLFTEISNNDISSSILFGLIFLGFALIAKSGIHPVLENLIPFPSSPLYR